MNIFLLTDIFLFNHAYVNYTNKITLICVSCLFYHFFGVFQTFSWILSNFYFIDIFVKISLNILLIFSIYPWNPSTNYITVFTIISNHDDNSQKQIDFSSHFRLFYYEKFAKNGWTLHVLSILLLQVCLAQSS